MRRQFVWVYTHAGSACVFSADPAMVLTSPIDRGRTEVA